MTFWSQAIVPGTYALHTLLFCSSIYVADSYVRSGGTGRLYALAALLGLGLAANWPLFVLLLPVPILWVLSSAKKAGADLASWKKLVLVALFLAFALVPYLHMLLLPKSASTYLGFVLPNDFIDYALKGQFSAYLDPDQHPRWDERHTNAGISLYKVATGMTWLGGFLGATGLFIVLRKWPTAQKAAMLWGLLVPTYLFGLYRPHGFDVTLATERFESMALTAHIPYAILVAVGLSAALAWLKGYFAKRNVQEKNLGFLPLLALVLPVLSLVLHYGKVDLSNDDIAMRYAGLVRGEVDPEHLLLASPSRMDYPLLYDRYITQGKGANAEIAQQYLDRVGPKPDIDQLEDYLGREEKQAVITAFVPYDLRKQKSHITHFSVGDFPVEETVEASDEALDFLQHAAEARKSLNSEQTKAFIDRLLYRFAVVALILAGVEDYEPNPRHIELLGTISETPGGKYASFLVSSIDDALAGNVDEVQAAVDEMGDLESFPVAWQVDVLSTLARTQVAAKKRDEARATLEQALSHHRKSQSTSIPFALLVLLAQQSDFEEYARLRRRHPGLDARLLSGLDAQCRSNLGVSCTQ